MAASTPRIPVPQVPIDPEYRDLFISINTYVHTYMSQYDNSHDYHHILRVISNANTILQEESKIDPSTPYDTTTLFLAALLHDVGDHKYTLPGTDASQQVYNMLVSHGASAALAATVQTIVTYVSYSNEVRNPASVIDVLAQHPELAIVQDADRLDAIGAVGIGRCFSFGAAKFPNEAMGRAIDHFEEKLVKLEGMMKTQIGRRMAKRRTEVLAEFMLEWKFEEDLSFELK
ncbi:hypothetical protein N0V91_010272 [Didymella pomorum]|uniref:HD/PDEase domain-containing protein n=1 Tax=Didymella pomorum TaxID=749634 RepID=A0A9W9D285_9PLEO|nr:hypothetical protein N0V91_010272 [Didymella pomorum]